MSRRKPTGAKRRRIRKPAELSQGNTGPGSRADVIVAAVTEEIIAGTRAPGSHLNEQELAERFKVSRTPVREALRQLSSAGLADINARRGAFVARIPIERLIQMFEVMSELEAASARLAARRMTAAEKAVLAKTHSSYEKYVTAADVSEYFDASNEFHRLVYAGAKNDVLQEMAQALYSRLAPYRRRQLALSRRTQKSYSEHGKVLSAIQAGDAQAAEEAMRGHTGVVGDNVMDLISSLGGK
jgi:DNA-binding GntR family transcriptional regulator